MAIPSLCMSLAVNLCTKLIPSIDSGHVSHFLDPAKIHVQAECQCLSSVLKCVSLGSRQSPALMGYERLECALTYRNCMS